MFDFAVFIITHGRPQKQPTYDFLKSPNTYLVCDNEDDTLEEYKERFGGGGARV